MMRNRQAARKLKSNDCVSWPNSCFRRLRIITHGLLGTPLFQATNCSGGAKLGRAACLAMPNF